LDVTKYTKDASLIPFTTLCSPNDSVDTIADNLENSITNLVDKHAPFKQTRVRPTRKRWITTELMKAISCKNRMFARASRSTNQDDWNTFKSYRNRVKRLIENAKKSHFHEQITNSDFNPITNTWKVINELNNKSKCKQDIKEIKVDNVSYTKPIDIANQMNTFFSTIGSNINNELKCSSTNNIDSHRLNIHGFKLQPITQDLIYRLLNSLPNQKKGGVCQIPTFMYKLIAPYIVRSLTLLINKIIITSTFPVVWKKALVTPLPKPGDPTDPSNRRPISSLMILSKIGEKAISAQIRNYLEQNSLISLRQYGFRQKHSTQSLLLQLSNRWLQTLDQKCGEKFLCLTALDIKKAFDTVDHDLLIS
jgi:hypothetical protein